jgi:hypothetical protein
MLTCVAGVWVGPEPLTLASSDRPAVRQGQTPSQEATQRLG